MDMATLATHASARMWKRKGSQSTVLVHAWREQISTCDFMAASEKQRLADLPRVQFIQQRVPYDLLAEAIGRSVKMPEALELQRQTGGKKGE
jgi:hypothetical protein